MRAMVMERVEAVRATERVEAVRAMVMETVEAAMAMVMERVEAATALVTERVEVTDTDSRKERRAQTQRESRRGGTSAGR